MGEIESLVGAVQTDVDSATDASAQAVSTGRLLLIVISVVGILGALLISWLFVGKRILRRVGQLSNRMRALAGGDLETPVDTRGRDEVAEMADALEVFRRDALEVQRLNLVEKLANELSERNEQLSQTLADLDRAQDQIVANEKLAALGEVTAGVAHEIRNPLNFVKNFAESSDELLEELLEAVADAEPPDEQADYIAEITGDLKQNLNRIRSHGDRANRIVESMLMMGRGGGESRPVEINALLDEHAMLSYHSARAQDPDFNVTIERDFDPEVGELQVIPQDMGRVFLNLVTNAGYAANQRWRELGGEPGKMVSIGDADDTPYFPTIWLSTRRTDESAVISVRDNGTGIPPDVAQRIFEPFFTTKPTNEWHGAGIGDVKRHRARSRRSDHGGQRAGRVHRVHRGTTARAGGAIRSRGRRRGDLITANRSSLVREGILPLGRQRDLEGIQRQRDQAVVAHRRHEFDDALGAEFGDGIGVGLVAHAMQLEQFSRYPVCDGFLPGELCWPAVSKRIEVALLDARCPSQTLMRGEFELRLVVRPNRAYRRFLDRLGKSACEPDCGTQCLGRSSDGRCSHPDAIGAHDAFDGQTRCRRAARSAAQGLIHLAPAASQLLRGDIRQSHSLAPSLRMTRSADQRRQIPAGVRFRCRRHLFGSSRCDDGAAADASPLVPCR